MTDKEVLLIAYGAIKVLGDERLTFIIEEIEAHLFMPSEDEAYPSLNRDDKFVEGAGRLNPLPVSGPGR